MQKQVMAVPYSNDLKNKVINLIKQGKTQIEISRLLQIDKITIYRWNKRFKETGEINFKGYCQNRDKLKIKPEKIEEIIKQNPSITLWEIARKIGKVSDVTILNYLQRLGYSFKKSHGYIKSEMKL